MNFVLAGVPFLVTALVAGALAALVFYHGPGRAAHRALATLLLGFAAYTGTQAVAAFQGVDQDSFLANDWARAGWLYESLMFLPAVPLALAWPARRPWAPRVLASLAFWLLLAGGCAAWAAFGARPDASETARLWYSIDEYLVLAPFGAALLLVHETRRLDDARARAPFVLMAIGLSAHAVYVVARGVAFLPRVLDLVEFEGWGPVWGAGVLGAFALWLGASLWLLPPGHDRTVARSLLIGAVVCGVLDSGLYYGMRQGLPFDYEGRLFLYALWILVPISLLAYLLLRGQIAGLDVKVRFGISKSTVAAAFVAVFFLASEGTQMLFGRGNEVVGLVAAGGLVFALAPLQRAADRIAATAVPAVDPTTNKATTPEGKADVYRRAVRIALRDRRLTPDEEVDLATVAHELGLGAPEAVRIRHEVEAQLRKRGR